MKRLVYSPSVKVWVRSDSGVVDLTPYVTECKIERKVDDLSKLEVIFRNPKILQDGKPRFLFTQRVQDNGELGPVFHPMDPITVILERIQGRPIQAFTGYCDTVPYVQLFPGLTRITASCTLKRLMYTFWDPALPFVTEFMREYGWELGGDGMARQGGSGNPDEEDKTEDTAKITRAIGNTHLNDNSIGYLLYAVLNEIGGWDSNNIYIQPLPDNISTTVQKLFDEFSEDNKDVNKEIGKLIKDIIGNGQFGNGLQLNVNASGGVSGNIGGALGGGTDLPSAPTSFLPELKPGIREVAYAVMKQFPGLVVTSSLRPADSDSFHGQGRAVDLGGSADLMKEAAEWIKTNLGKNLAEGIHNPNLSIDNQQTVPNSFWISSSYDGWADHIDHIHLAV